MNNGAFIFKKELFNSVEIEQIADLTKALAVNKKNVHSGGKYADLKWFQVDLSPELGFIKKLLKELNSKPSEMMVFYYLEPGAKLHPHRDLTGASLNNRLRFHVPIITNPGVIFQAAGEVVKMLPGDLWCLDTSYVHSVENKGSESRVHLIIECDINSNIRSRIPGGLKANFHSAIYALILASSLVKALFVNSVKDPKYFKDQIRMVIRFVKWRIFRIGKAK
jgi:quercetin dioxygenase-like cupin family protein